MKEINLSTKIRVFSYEELDAATLKLVEAAKLATQRSYAPYSTFQVGAAVLLSNGEIVSGSNQENAAYPSGLCAERVALFYANSRYPNQSVEALGIAAYTQGAFIDRITAPCGACRQVILESEDRFETPIRIILYGSKEVYVLESVKDLLPLHFSKKDL